MTAPDSECAPRLAAFSSTQTLKAGLSCFRRIAQASPAGPAPTIATSYSMTSRGVSLIELHLSRDWAGRWGHEKSALVDHKPGSTGEASTRRTADEGICAVPSLYSVGTPMLTGHGRRLPGWPRDLGMARARTPTPLLRRTGVEEPAAASARLSPAPAGLALGEEGAETFLGFCLDAQARQTRLPLPWRQPLGPGADARATSRMSALASRQSARAPLQQRLDDARAARVEQLGGHDFVHQPHLLRESPRSASPRSESSAAPRSRRSCPARRAK